jgi:hypothetical protein
MFGGELTNQWKPTVHYSTAETLISSINELIEHGFLHASVKLVRLSDNAEIKVSAVDCVHHPGST